MQKWKVKLNPLRMVLELKIVLAHWIELWRCNYELCTERMGENENRISD